MSFCWFVIRDKEAPAAPEPPAREVSAKGVDARSLGLALAKIYGERTERGLKHAKEEEKTRR